MKPLSSGLKAFLRIGISILLIGFFFYKTDTEKLLVTIREITPWVWTSAFSLLLLAQIISVFRWKILSRAIGFLGSMTQFIVFYFSGMFFNLFLPTSIGGDVLKVFFLSRGEARKLPAAYSVLADRMFGLLTLVLIGAFTVLINPGLLPPFLRNFLWISGLGALGIILFPLKMHKILEKHFPKIASRVSMVIIYWKKPYVLTTAIFLSFLLQVLGIVALPVLAHSLQIDQPISLYFVIFPIVAIVTILPVSLGGLGVREGSFIYLLGLKGVPMEKALVLSLGFFFLHAALGLIGGLMYSLGLHKKEEVVYVPVEINGLSVYSKSK